MNWLKNNFFSKASWQAGQAMIIAMLFFVSVSALTALGLAAPVIREMKDANRMVSSKQSRALAEGLLEDVIYRYKNGVFISAVEFISDGATVVYATSTPVLGGISIVASGNTDRAVRDIRGFLNSGTGAAFFYGVQVGDGGIDLNNSAEIYGSVFSNGPVTGGDNLIRGDAISAGGSGLIDNIHATGTAYSHTIRNSVIDKDAYYQAISGSTVGGTSHPGSSDQPPGTLPISDDQILEWETAAAAGGSVTCSGGVYNSPSILTIGPKKIPCDFNISGSDTINLTGPLWVTGNINISNTAVINVDVSQTGRSAPVIADKTTNRTTSSKINISNSAVFNGAGANSYVIFISKNNSAESGGGEDAISISNSASGKVLIYAGHGKITISNSVNIKEVTAYRIVISNSARVIYESGLANLLFSSGPSGGYTIGKWADE